MPTPEQLPATHYSHEPLGASLSPEDGTPPYALPDAVTAVPAPESTSRRVVSGNTTAYLAAAALLLSAGGEIISPSQATAAPSKAASAERYSAASEKLRLPNTLPGKNRKVSSQARRHLKNATVKILKRQKADGSGISDKWQDWCVGVKINTPNGPAVSSANHCVSDRLGSESGLISPNNFEGQPEALDFIEQSDTEFAISDGSRDIRPRQIIGTVNSLVLNTQLEDKALFGVVPSKDRPTRGRTYDKIPSLEVLNGKYRPIPGQQVGLYGLPKSNNGKPVASTGVYLSRYRDLDGVQYDLVGTNPRKRSKDAGSLGASGGSFIASIGKKHFVSGPLSSRISKTYDSNRTSTGGLETNSKRIQANRKASDRLVRDMEIATGVKIKGQFNTVLRFAVQTEGSVKEMAAATGRYPIDK